MGKRSCDRLKKIEQVDPLPTLQDGKFKRCSNNGLDVQIRPEGCLNFGSLTQKLQR